MLTRVSISLDSELLDQIDTLKARAQIERPAWPFATRGVVRRNLSNAQNAELDAFLAAYAKYKAARDQPFTSRSKAITNYLTNYFAKPSPLKYQEIRCPRTGFTLDVDDALVAKLDEMVMPSLLFEKMPDRFLSAEALKLKRKPREHLFPNRSRALEQICRLYAPITKS